MRTRLLLIALVLAALAACDRPAPAPAGPVPATGTLRVADPAGSQGPLKLTGLTRLQLDGTYLGAPGTHAVRIDVTGPTGVVYTQLRGALEAGADGRATTARSLEVRGTPIDAYHMTGAWKFALVVDDTPLASATVDVTD
jgi:hypothetical protein